MVIIILQGAIAGVIALTEYASTQPANRGTILSRTTALEIFT